MDPRSASLALALTLIGCGPGGGETVLTVDEDGWGLGRQPIPLEPTRNELREILGPPSRELEGGPSYRLVWDALGLDASSPTGTQRIG